MPNGLCLFISSCSPPVLASSTDLPPPSHSRPGYCSTSCSCYFFSAQTVISVPVDETRWCLVFTKEVDRGCGIVSSFVVWRGGVPSRGVDKYCKLPEDNPNECACGDGVSDELLDWPPTIDGHSFVFVVVELLGATMIAMRLYSVVTVFSSAVTNIVR